MIYSKPALRLLSADSAQPACNDGSGANPAAGCVTGGGITLVTNTNCAGGSAPYSGSTNTAACGSGSVPVIAACAPTGGTLTSYENELAYCENGTSAGLNHCATGTTPSANNCASGNGAS